MNAAATARRSMIRMSMLAVPAGRPAYSNDVEALPPGAAATVSNLTARQAAAGGDRRGIQVVDYLEYKAQCEYEREREAAVYSASYEDLSKPRVVVVEVEASTRGRIVRMFTVFPFRDMNWIVSWLYIIGSLAFLFNALLGLLPTFSPGAVTPPLSLTATATTGSVMFVSAAWLGQFAAFNATRGTIEVPVEGDGRANYRPALIGSPSWVWIPSSAEWFELLGTLPYRAGLVQLIGGMALATATAASFPGVLRPDQVDERRALVPMAQAVGGSLIVLGNTALLFFMQEHWYVPLLSSSDWLGGFFNTVGAAGFAFTGIFGLLNDPILPSYMALLGAAFFSLGTIIQLYSLMEFHPTAWAL